MFDRYHLMTHMGKAVDEVRKAESREMVKNDGVDAAGVLTNAGIIGAGAHVAQPIKLRFVAAGFLVATRSSGIDFRGD